MDSSKKAGQNNEWWKLQRGLNKADPKIQSRIELKQSQQYWAKNDLNLLSDVTLDMAPIDPFKESHISKIASKDIPAKVNEIHYTSDEALNRSPDTEAPGFRHKQKWSTTFNEIRCLGKDRTFDKIIKQNIV